MVRDLFVYHALAVKRRRSRKAKRPADRQVSKPDAGN
jgi:hypothetical protein